MMIPESVYRLVEKKLRDRWELVPRAELRLYNAQARATAPGASAPSKNRPGSGSHRPDRMEQLAAAVIQAEADLEQARKWLHVFSLMDRVFPFESTQEGYVAGLMYGNGMNQEEICRFTHCERKAVRRRRDTYVCHCALIAASEGLIHLDAGLNAKTIMEDENP